MTRQNRLANETSPYLQQHAENPVDWYPWGPEALQRAKELDRPILLSIGYSACHWCHVMERESFDNEEIAQLMNDYFVPVKVDREERPDLDEIYMAATVAMSGSGGWPMTVFLTPGQEPFFAGTYFPPTDHGGRPGFKTLLVRIADLWRSERGTLVQQAGQLLEHLKLSEQAAEPMPVDRDAIEKAVAELSQSFDEHYGGFSRAPKFPPCASLSLLLRHHRRSGDAQALEMVQRTLGAMRRGGIYDHLAGGFARYSTDERWLVPHFEKMLYDNAQLASVYIEAFQVTGNLDYRQVAKETLDYVIREMQGEHGGYFTATDADSDGEEGKFFVWSHAEVVQRLGPEEAKRFCAYYDVTPEGNWEGKNVLHTPRPKAEVARQLGISEAKLDKSLQASKQKLYEARLQRTSPLLDDKILTANNGLMIAAMAEGYRVLRDRRYLESAERAAGFLLQQLRRPDGGLYRTARGERAHLHAYLDDYAYLSDGLLTLFEAGAEAQTLQASLDMAERMVDDFASDDGGFYYTAHEHEKLLVRHREGHDGALPNPNAIAARALLRLARHFDRSDFEELGRQSLFAYGRAIERMPRAFCSSLQSIDWLSDQIIEIALIGTPDDDAYEALCQQVALRYLPNRLQAHHDPALAPSALPLLSGKSTLDGQPAAYVCRNFVCQEPLSDAAALGRALDEHNARSQRTHQTVVPTLAGCATVEATAQYAAQLKEIRGGAAFVKLGVDWTVGRIGFGSYRVSMEEAAHRESLDSALRSGANLIDTSSNYMDGESERLIGQVLRQLVDEHVLRREEVVVISKVGYAQGQNLQLARRREAEGKPFPEMVKVGQNMWHCIHPEWIDEQLTRSLSRLGLDTLDVYLLHNPEYFLKDAKKQHGERVESLREEYYSRIERAFEALEEEVRRGRIRCYGVSSNTFVSPHDDPEASSLSRVVEAAKRAGGANHSFRVIQFPFNLLEPGALLEKNNHGRTVLEVAKTERLSTLANRPLNAVAGDALLRLADPPFVEQAPKVEEQLAVVQRLEARFARDLFPRLQVSGDATAEALFSWGSRLQNVATRLGSYQQYEEIEQRVIAPQLTQHIGVVEQAFKGDPDFAAWKQDYIAAMQKLSLAFRALGSELNRMQLSPVLGRFSGQLPVELAAEPFSRKALWALLSTNVDVVLVGMRKPAYVEDALSALAWPKAAELGELFSGTN